MTPWRLSAREMARRPGRALLTVLSIVLGVAAVVSDMTSAATTRATFQESHRSLVGKAGLEVLASGGGSFDAELLGQIAQVPGVKAAVPLVQRPTSLRASGGKPIRLLLVGIDPERDRLVRDYELRAGRFCAAADEAMVEAGLAEGRGIQLDQTVKILTPRGLKTLTVVGFLAPTGAAGYSQGAVLFLPLASAQRWFKASGKVDAVNVLLAEGADAGQTAGRINRVLPAGIVAQVPAARTQIADETLFATHQGLDLAGALSLVAAAFIVVNTLLINVTERRRELAMLRAIGATRGQVMRLIVREALVYALVGTALGLVAGLGGAWLLTRMIEGFLQISMPGLRITWPPLAAGAALGLVLSLAAACIPAGKAGRLSPLEGLGIAAGEDLRPTPAWLTVGSLLAVVLLIAFIVGCIVGWLPTTAAIPAAAMAIAACVPLFAAALGPVTRVLSALLRPLITAPLHLALRQLVRLRLRTTFTIGVVFVAISTAIGLGTTILNNTQDVKDWYHRTVIGDFFVRASMPDMASGLSADLPEGTGAELEAMPGVKGVGAVRFVSAKAAGQSVIVIARPFLRAADPTLDLRSGNPAEVVDRLHEGQTVIGSVLAQRTGLGRGDSLTIETGGRRATVRIAGVTNEYVVGGLALYLDKDAARRLLGIDGADAYVVKAEPAARAALVERLTRFTHERGLLLQSYAELSRMIEGMANSLTGGLWVLLALGLVVSAFGMVNTLTMNVLEQSRELALLRVAGMTRRQLQGMILYQAGTMGLVALAPGLAVGVLMAYLINLASLPVLGHAVDFALHPWFLGACFLAALAVVVGSAWLPARRAAALVLAESLAGE